ncbi:hypothetical protein Pelo_15687 [Pelomyxa schiedti]|nr:hypothetical protein Pelo_15687 [Pelomyxa schiedti]
MFAKFGGKRLGSKKKKILVTTFSGLCDNLSLRFRYQASWCPILELRLRAADTQCRHQLRLADCDVMVAKRWYTPDMTCNILSPSMLWELTKTLLDWKIVGLLSARCDSTSR